MDNTPYEVLMDFIGSPDGSRVIEYKKGDTLTKGADFSDDLAEVALAEKWVQAAKPAPRKVVKKKAKR